MKPRCLIIFEESCRTDVTRKAYLFQLKKLERPDLYDKKTVNEKLDVFVIA